MTLEQLFQGGPALVPGALLGYRTWDLYRGLDRIASTGISYVYGPPGTVEIATCRRDSHAPAHEAPSHECACGFYGWYRPADTRIVPAGVFGAVRATGRVVLGTHGFRAQQLQVLAVTAALADDRATLRRAGFIVYDTREQLLRAHPPEDISALVDHHCDHRCRTIPVLSPTGVAGRFQAAIGGWLAGVAAAAQARRALPPKEGTRP